MWKEEYQENRKRKYASDPEYRAQHRARCRTPEENKIYMREYYARNRDKWPKRTAEQQALHNEKRREKYRTCAEHRAKIKEQSKQFCIKNPHIKKRGRLKKYGLTIEQFNAMLESQGGCCAICGMSDTSRKEIFPLVDHCHTTNKVRGLLCEACNQESRFSAAPLLPRTALRQPVCIARRRRSAAPKFRPLIQVAHW